MDGLADQLWLREADQLLEKGLDDLRVPDLEGICGIADQLLEKDLDDPRVPDLFEGMDGIAGHLWGVVLPNRESA